jgi:RNA polymerase sigma-70 factor (ECF subfamily)
MPEKSTNDEHELVLRLIADDEDAFCELYSAYKERLIYFALKFVKSRDFAEDIFQDVFTIIWKGRHFIDADSSFSSYLYTIVHNRILNELRDLENEDRLKENILSHAIDYNDETQQYVFTHDLLQIIQRAIEQLTPTQREVFQMSRNAHMSHKEIAESLHISVNTVQEHISTSLKSIRTYLIKYAGTYTDIIILLFCSNI